ncbi:hypothetical protein [Pseudoalteromonas aurantia]|uniref:Phage tail tape measure protein n=1 Tax=Pseudoalteromonas aurantia TaxID=43654 RepID=A0A5S3V5X2_9GAMM|nr:hypothetical protein [Pseudoalteromonas aurantia]TMO66752.1 hypothetical protein CWC19_15550 [Pseudoalteromonas aurantia]
MATNLELSVQTLTKSSGSATKALAALESQFKKTLKANTNFSKGLVNTDKTASNLITKLSQTTTSVATLTLGTKSASQELRKFTASLNTSIGSSRTFRSVILKSQQATFSFASAIKSTNAVAKGMSKSVLNAASSTSKLTKGTSGAAQNLSTLETQLARTTKQSNQFSTAMYRAGKASSAVPTATSSSNSEGGDKPKGKLGKLGGVVGEISGAFGGPTTLIETAVAGISKVTEVTKQFETLQARIETISTSSAHAKTLFANINDIAEQTPHGLEQTTNSFIALANNGLTPTKAAMTAYGDIASTLGLTLEEVSNSVIDTTSNSALVQQNAFAALGVTAEKNGEVLSLSFNGVKTTIQNDSASIQTYLTQLGQNNFAGAMAKEMDTLGGKMTRFGSEWDELFLNVGNAGVGDAIKSSISLGTSALQGLNDSLASGELLGYFDAITTRYKNLYDFDELVEGVGSVKKLFSSALDSWDVDVGGALDSVSTRFMYLPETIKVMIKSFLQHLSHLPEQGLLYINKFADGIYNGFETLKSQGAAYGSEFLDSLNPFDGDTFDYDSELKKIALASSTRAAASETFFKKEMQLVKDAKASNLAEIKKERDESISAFEAQIAKAKELSKAYDEANATRDKNFSSASTNDALGLKKAVAPSSSTELVTQPNKVVADAQQEQTDIVVKACQERNKKVAELEQQRTESLLEQSTGFLNQLAGLGSLLNADITSPEQVADIASVTRETYDSGAALYDSFFQEGEGEGSELSTEEEAAIEEERNSEKLAVTQEFLEQQTAIQEEKDAEKLAATQNFLEQQTEVEVAQAKVKSERVAQIEQNEQSSRLSQASDFFGGVANVAKVFGGKQSKAAKAAAIAQTTIKTYESATNAYSSLASIPYIGPALGIAAAAAAVSAGMANVQAIKSTNYAGAYDHGGLIPAGKIGLVGEYGPELISGPVNVTSRRTTAGLSASNSNTEPTPQNIDKSVKFNYVVNANDSEGVAQVMKKERAKILRDVRYAMESGEWD